MSITSTVIYIIGLFLVAFTTAMLVYKHDAEMLHNYRERIMELLSIHAKNLLEKAEIEKKSFTLEQINAGLMADNARLTAERDAAKTQQKETKKPETAAPEAKPEPENSGEVLPIPDAPTNVLSCEPYMTKEKDESGNIRYKNAFAANSEQAMLQEDCFTDENGIRYYKTGGKKCLCAALATAYSTEIGTVFEAELKNGTKLLIICADFKNPLEEANEPIYGTPCANYDVQDAVCLFEFVVDWTKLPRIVKDAGTFTVLPQFGGLYGDGGNVVKLTKLGRWWKP